MVKISGLIATILIVLALIVGGLATYYAFPQEKTITKDVIKEVQVPYEVIKITEVPAPSDLDKAVATFMEAADNEEDEAGNEVDVQNGYNFEDISISKISKDWSASYTKDTTEVDFEITLKYKEAGTDERSEKETYDVKVIYELDEDTIVQIL